MTASPAPAVPAEILTMLRADAPGVVNAAAIAPAVSLPPGMAPVPAVTFEPAPAPAAEPTPVHGAAALPPAGDPAPVPALVVGAGVPLPAAAAQAVRYLNGTPRSKRLELMWPLELGGRVFDAITVSRPNTRQVADYYDAVQALPEGVRIPRFPVFCDDAGSPVPDAVLDALDDDDATMVFGAVADFLPVRLRLLTDSPAEPSPHKSGDDTEQKSST